MSGTGSITDVAGLRVGHCTDARRPTGCTVVLVPAGTVGGVDVRGAAPGTRETELLSPLNAVDEVHAVLLAGGSAFGLDAAGGVMRWLDERGIGIAVGQGAAGPVRVPIVPAAILFDLFVGDARVRPDAASGYAACEAASEAPVAQGNLGAGAGCSVGKLFGMQRAMRGGLGSASLTVGGITVGALVAVNAVGDVIDPSTGRIVAGARTADGRSLLGTTDAIARGEAAMPMAIGTATTLGVIATNAALTKAQATKLAQMAHDGFARSIDPVHTMSDGDTIFVLATGRPPAGTTAGGGGGNHIDLTRLGALGARVMAQAVLNAVLHARRLEGAGLPSLPSAHDL